MRAGNIARYNKYHFIRTEEISDDVTAYATNVTTVLHCGLQLLKISSLVNLLSFGEVRAAWPLQIG